MRDISTWRRALPVALILALLVVTEAGLIAQNLGSAPQTNVAVQGQTGAQPEGTWLNLINWIRNPSHRRPRCSGQSSNTWCPWTQSERFAMALYRGTCMHRPWLL